MKKLGGTLFVIDGIKYDYCFKESILSLKEFCDEIVVVDAGSLDGTVDVLKTLEDKKTKIIYLDRDEWDNQHGKEKLAFFTNRAIENLTVEWNFNCQSDEVLSERSYDTVRKAINSGIAEAYMCSRINLWESPYLQLNVEHARMPCSKEIIRLAKTQYRSCGDAESIDAQCVMNFVNDIQIYHYGFVRKKEVMKSKIINMQENVFGMGHDKKLDGSDIFDSTLWFSGEDLKVIDYPHPKIMKEWIKERP